jgi:hypothetical protein
MSTKIIKAGNRPMQFIDADEELQATPEENKSLLNVLDQLVIAEIHEALDFDKHSPEIDVKEIAGLWKK